jgi:hypothetical protein
MAKQRTHKRIVLLISSAAFEGKTPGNFTNGLLFWHENTSHWAIATPKITGIPGLPMC